jgi:putative DNA primase/helicase
LNVVGEDSIDVNAKGVKAATSTSLPVKFMLLGNSLPAFRDPAMALINRVVLIQFQNSFVGKEDTELTQKLMSEIDGIFSWTLIGYDKMLSDYRLPQPESGKATIENFRKLVSPIRGFVFDCCELSEDRSGPEINGDRDQIFEMWRIYCEKIGREHPGTRSSFVRNLIESFPSIQESKLGSGRNGERRWWALVNIRLSLESLKEVDENRTQNQDADSKEGFA